MGVGVGVSVGVGVMVGVSVSVGVRVGVPVSSAVAVNAGVEDAAGAVAERVAVAVSATRLRLVGLGVTGMYGVTVGARVDGRKGAGARPGLRKTAR